MAEDWVMSYLENVDNGLTMEAFPPAWDILDEIASERQKQDVTWGVQRHPDTMHGYLDKNGADDFISTYLHAGLLSAVEKELADARKAYDESVEMGLTNWAEILEEEFWEAILEAYKGDKAKLREELIQVASVAVAWVECLDAAE